MNTHLTLQLTIDDTNLILEALGQMPYARVSNLIQNIQSQAQPQLQNTAHESDQNTANN